MSTTTVRGYSRSDGTHVRAHTRRVDGRTASENELPTEEHDVGEDVHVKRHESHSASGRKESVRAYDYKRDEKRFGGHSRELHDKVYREYRAKGYSKAESERIAGDVVGDVYRKKLKEAK